MAIDNITQLFVFYSSMTIKIDTDKTKQNTDIDDLQLEVFNTESEINKYILSQYISGNFNVIERISDTLNSYKYELNRMCDVSFIAEINGDNFVFEIEHTNEQIKLKLNSIDRINAYVSQLLNKVHQSNEPVQFDTDIAAKVCFMYEIGIIDLLIRKGLTNNKVAELLEYLTKEPIKKGSANVALSRIINEGLLDKYKGEIAALKLKFNLVKSE